MWADACHWTRTRLPLLAGDDLVGNDRRRAQRHLISCPGCRRRLDDLRSTLGVLHLAAAQSPARASAPSLWPEIARQICEQRHPAIAASWGVSWSNAGFWSGAALAAGLVVVASVLFRPGPTPVVRVDPLTRQAPPALVSTPAPAAARPEEPGESWTSEQDALAFAQEPPKAPEPGPRRDEPNDRPRDGAPEIQPTR